jgi:hypothetical protein
MPGPDHSASRNAPDLQADRRRVDTAEEMAEWCGGEVTWRADDLAVVRATYA